MIKKMGHGMVQIEKSNWTSFLQGQNYIWTVCTADTLPAFQAVKRWRIVECIVSTIY